MAKALTVLCIAFALTELPIIPLSYSLHRGLSSPYHNQAPYSTTPYLYASGGTLSNPYFYATFERSVGTPIVLYINSLPPIDWACFTFYATVMTRFSEIMALFDLTGINGPKLSVNHGSGIIGLTIPLTTSGDSHTFSVSHTFVSGRFNTYFVRGSYNNASDETDIEYGMLDVDDCITIVDYYTIPGLIKPDADNTTISKNLLYSVSGDSGHPKLSIDVIKIEIVNKQLTNENIRLIVQ